MKGIHLEVLLACGYTLFLIGAAVLLEWTARHTHQRAKLYHHRGFTYRRHLDIWECPVGEPLHPRGADPARRVVRYQARAEKCNSCMLKENCTDSNEGRELLHSTQDWLETEIGRFHRGLSLGLLALAILILLAAWVRHHGLLDSVVLALAVAGASGTSLAFARSFWKGVPKQGRQGPFEFSTLSSWSDTSATARGRPTRPFS